MNPIPNDNYIMSNKAAWEEAYPHHQAGYQVDMVDQLREKDVTFLNAETMGELQRIDLQGKRVAQFCCNNGRELLSLIKLGAQSGVGFDIAENFVEYGNRCAKRLQFDCRLISTNIYDIDPSYANQFDLLLVTIGALCWFQDLDRFFQKASMVLRKHGWLLINELHPFTEMLAAAEEEEFNASHPLNAVNPYFREKPWIETDGKDYIGGTTYPSKPFTSFTHTFTAIINALVQNGFAIQKLTEFDDDISGLFGHLNGHSVPLSYLMRCEKLGV